MKINKYFRLFLEEDGIPTGGGGAPSAEGTPPAAAPATSATLDPKAFAQEFGSVIAEQFQKNAPAPAPKTYTPEEIAAAQKAYGFWEPDDEFLKNFDNLETRKSAMLAMRDGMFKQVMNVVQAIIAQHGEGLTKTIDERFQPVQKILTERAVAERTERFNTKYPALSKPGLQPLLNAVANQLHAAGKLTGDETKDFDELARGVEAVIKETNPDFTLGAGGPPSSSNERQGSQIPTSSSGSGGGGSNGSGGGKSNLPIAAQVLGNPRPPRK